MDRKQFHPNTRRKVDSMDLPKPIKMRIKTDEKALKLETLRKDLEDRSRKYGDQSLLEYILNLAWAKYEELEEKEEEFNDAAV